MPAGGSKPQPPREREGDRGDTEVQSGDHAGEHRQAAAVLVELLHHLAHVKRGERDLDGLMGARPRPPRLGRRRAPHGLSVPAVAQAQAPRGVLGRVHEPLGHLPGCKCVGLA